MFDKAKKGYIKLNRNILDNSIWLCEPFTKGQAWVDLLLLTNHRENLILLKNGLIMNINRGECGYSKKALADRWKWSRNKVTRYLNYLEKQEMIQQKNTQNHTIIKVFNYEKWQGELTNETTNGTTNGTTNDTTNKTINETTNNTTNELTNEQQTIQQTDINNNDKNDKNNNKNIYSENFSKKIDPYFNNPIIEKFKAEYQKAFRVQRCYLDNIQIHKILEISADYPEFVEKMPEIISKFRKIKFTNGIGAPSLKWLINEGNWASILNGERDKNIEKPEENSGEFDLGIPTCEVGK